ncbi:MAG: phytase [Gemmatimonadota bacterium]
MICARSSSSTTTQPRARRHRPGTPPVETRRVLLLAGISAALVSGCAPSDSAEGTLGAEERGAVATVAAAAETQPVAGSGDVADDPAIWLHPTEPAASRIIGTAKDEGLYVYDLEGAVVQRVEDGRMNNVDVRYRFPLGGREVDIVAASEQNGSGVALYAIGPETGRLTNAAAGQQASGFESISGLCMYHSRRSGAFYVFANDPTGLFRQWELVAEGDGIAIRQVRDFQVDTQAEGCAADDIAGALYVAEEDVALWRYDAEPDGGDQATLVGSVEELPDLQDDLEGITVYHGMGGAGYLIVSNQGANTYSVFDLEGDNPYVGTFAIAPDGAAGIDGTSDSDGVQVISTALGPGFPAGLFVAQDGANEMPDENQNFKLVRWDAIADAVGLETFEGWDPRDW